MSHSRTKAARMKRPARLVGALALGLASLPLHAQTAGQGSQSSREGASVLIPLPFAQEEASGLFSPDLEAAYIEALLERDDSRARAAPPNTDLRPALITPLRPIEARGFRAGSALRFDGETRSLDFAMYAPDPDRISQIRITTLSSINVLPERSSYRVWLNNTQIGTGVLDRVTQPGPRDFPVPAGLMRRGLNDVRVELVQHHRIYCGPEASFALWTDIDLARSGGVIAEGGGEASAEGFLMGLAATAAAGETIEIRGIEGLGEQAGAWVEMITQRMAAALGGDPIPFVLGGFWGLAPQAPVASRITFLPGAATGVRFQRGGDGAQVLVVEYVPGSLPGPLPAFDTLFMPRIDRIEPTLIETRRPVAFSEFGFETYETHDRYARVERRFRLPDDYVVLTNDKAEIRITYAYDTGLPEGSMLQVHVNGTNIRLLPLRGDGGRAIEDFPLHFEARLLRPGENTVAFESFVPGNPPDLPCEQRERPMLAVSDGTTLLAPYSPAMYLPDMHFAFTALDPRSVTTSDLTGRAFSELDVLTLRAALSAAPRPDAGEQGARLHVISVEDLANVPNGGYQISRATIENTLSPLRGSDPLTGQALTSEVARSSGGAGLLRGNRRSEPEGGITGSLTAGWDWVVTTAGAAAQWMHPVAGRRLEMWLEPQRAQAMLLQLDPARPQDIWLLRAPGSSTAAIASAMVLARATGDGPRGQVSLLDHNGMWQNWVAPDRQPVLLEPITVSNFRHVVGNYVSAMPIRYVTALFFLALVSAVFALRLVITTREH